MLESEAFDFAGPMLFDKASVGVMAGCRGSLKPATTDEVIRKSDDFSWKIRIHANLAVTVDA